MKLYIVRHGQTGYNIDNKVCGISDVELTSLGKQQAKMASEQLKDISLDMIFASPLQRAHETAKIINENHQLEIKIKKSILANLKELLIMKNFNIINKIMDSIIQAENLYSK